MKWVRRLGVIAMSLSLGVAGTIASTSIMPGPGYRSPRSDHSPRGLLSEDGSPSLLPSTTSDALPPLPRRGTVTPAEPGAEVVRGSYIVAVTRGLDPRRVARQIAADHGGEAGVVFAKVIGGFEFRGSEAAADELARDARVRAVHPNYVVHTAHFNSGYPDFLTQTAATPRPPAGFNGEGIRIAILDTGARASNTAISGNVVDPTGVSKPTTSGGPCGFPAGGDDFNGHGTRTTGNAVGTHGIALSAKAVPVKVFPGSGSSTDWVYVACGLEFVLNRNTNGTTADDIKVVNMSLSGSYSGVGTCTDGGLREAVCEVAGTTPPPSPLTLTTKALLFAAAGNSPGSPGAPAKFPEVAAISGFNTTSDLKTLWSSSARGSKIAIGAPAVNICSPNISQGSDCASDMSPDTITNGTSRSSPMVAGAAAILLGLGTPMPEVLGTLQKGGKCPSGSQNTVEGPCPSGTWTNDSDGITEPLLNVSGAVGVAGAGSIPTASFVSPTGTTDVGGTAVPIQIAAYDGSETDAGDLDVQLSVGCGTAPQPTYNGAPSGANWITSWNTTGCPEDTAAAIQAVVTDTDTPTNHSRTINVSPVVDNSDSGPSVQWVSPTNGATVGPSFGVTVAASDDNDTPTVELFVDGSSKGLLSGPSSGKYTGSVSGLSPGSHTLRADANDGHNAVVPASISVTVANTIYQQNFDSDSDDPNDLSNWKVYTTNAGSGSSYVRWHVTSSCGAGYNNTTKGIYYGQTDHSPCNYSNGYANSGYVYAPTFSGLPSSYQLTLHSKRKVESCSSCTRDQTYIEISYNGGSSWTRPYYRDARNASSGAWETLTFDLGSSSSSTLRVRFRFATTSSSNNGYFGWAFDDFKLSYS